MLELVYLHGNKNSPDILLGACCLAGSRSPMHGRYLRVVTGNKMALGSPRSATSVLFDKGARVFSPAVGRGTVLKLGAYGVGRLLGS